MGQCFTTFSKFGGDDGGHDLVALPPVLMLKERSSDTVQLFPDGLTVGGEGTALGVIIANSKSYFEVHVLATAGKQASPSGIAHKRTSSGGNGISVMIEGQEDSGSGAVKLLACEPKSTLTEVRTMLQDVVTSLADFPEHFVFLTKTKAPIGSKAEGKWMVKDCGSNTITIRATGAAAGSSTDHDDEKASLSRPAEEARSSSGGGEASLKAGLVTAMLAVGSPLGGDGTWVSTETELSLNEGDVLGVAYDQDSFPTSLTFYKVSDAKGDVVKSISKIRGDVRPAVSVTGGARVKLVFKEADLAMPLASLSGSFDTVMAERRLM